MSWLSEKRARRRSIKRRTAGFYADRIDGMGDILHRVAGASVLDIGCNRGMVSFQFAEAGATRIHGCDIYEDGIKSARGVFSEWPIDSRFEIVDLAGGIAAIERAFRGSLLSRYTVVLYLAVHHKLKPTLPAADLKALVDGLFQRCSSWFLWRGPASGYGDIADAAERHGFRLVQFSTMSVAVHDPAAIFRRRGWLEKPGAMLVPAQEMIADHEAYPAPQAAEEAA